jgi:hypothetical protein
VVEIKILITKKLFLMYKKIIYNMWTPINQQGSGNACACAFIAIKNISHKWIVLRIINNQDRLIELYTVQERR